MRARFVLVCQQFLALGLVVAIAGPASSLVTLDIVAPASSGLATARLTAGSPVAVAPVKPTVTEVPMTGVDPQGLRSLGLGGAARLAVAQRVTALTGAEPVKDFATVGVTWDHGVTLADGQIHVSMRSLDHGVWSGWQTIRYDADHGPDPGTREARHARHGTEPFAVGNVDDVQVKAVTASGAVPAGMRLALVDPGRTVTRIQQPAIDTAKLGSARSSSATSGGTLVTPQPRIFSRAQWGADESMRDPSSLHYGEVHAGFVHHTVNANGYSRAQVPAILRGIYAYHTQSLGWSDIGYNYLIDRFGRIWEGRYGGVDRPVVGAHTLNYNENSFGASAIGNYQIARPSSAMLHAYGRLFAWKLSLHGVDPGSPKQWVGSKYFKAISGHRDAGQTLCPGQYLYNKLPTIRRLAEGDQSPWSGRQRKTDISGTHWPDLVVRNAATKEAYVVHTGGQLGFGGAHRSGTGWGADDLVTATRDVTGDGNPDLMARDASTKVTSVYPGDGQNHFGAATDATPRFANLDQMVGVGDLDGDGHPDIVGRRADGSHLYLFRGKGGGQFKTAVGLSSAWGSYNLTLGVGDLTGDGKPDLASRDSAGKLWLFPGDGHGGIGSRREISGGWNHFDLLNGMGDLTNDGIPDIAARSKVSKLVYIYPGDGAGGLGPRIGGFAGFSHLDFLAAGGRLGALGHGHSDLVGRNSKGKLVVFDNNGRRNIGSVVDTGSTFSNANLVLNVGDWNGDGHGDVMTRSATSGNVYLRTGDGASHFSAPVLVAKSWNSVRLLAPVGDITGDGFPDLMGQPAGGAMRIYPGDGSTGFKRSYVAHSAIAASRQVGVGLWNGDGSPDSVMRTGGGSLTLYPGNGPGGLTTGHKIGSRAGRYDWIIGAGDVNGDGEPDLVARSRVSGKLWLLPGNGSQVEPRRLIAAGFGKYDLGG